MRKIYLSSVVFPALAAVAVVSAACNKTRETPPAPSSPAAPPPAVPAAQPPPAAAPAPAAAPSVDDEVRQPRIDDLAGYIADIKGTGPLQALIDTTMGELNCELFEKKAPLTVANFVGLARGKKAFRNPKTGAVEKRPFYDGLGFHRVIPGFMIQGGDMMGAGVGDPGYKFATEVDPSLKHELGTLAMANAGPNTNGSQFYITESAPTHLDGGYNIFGRCKEVDLVKRIARVPKDPANASKPATPVLMKRVVIHR